MWRQFCVSPAFWGRWSAAQHKCGEHISQKIERLRAFPLRAGVPLCKSAKLNELGFARLQGQRKFIKALAEDSLDSFSIFPILEADHEVIDVPDQVGLPFESRLDHLFKPEV